MTGSDSLEIIRMLKSRLLASFFGERTREVPLDILEGYQRILTDRVYHKPPAECEPGLLALVQKLEAEPLTGGFPVGLKWELVREVNQLRDLIKESS